MSFILDALKKSENDRQEQAEAEFTTVPSSPSSPAAPRWLWILGGLLAINIIAVLGLMFRPDSQPGTAPPIAMPATAPEVAAVDDADSFSDQVESARRNQPARRVSESTPPPGAAQTSPQPARVQTLPVSVEKLPISATALLPSLIELRANGTLQLPDLHVDIHVYSDVPADRFVFINMNKYKEDSRLDEGPVLKEITSDGVILEFGGTAFVLPRD